LFVALHWWQIRVIAPRIQYFVNQGFACQLTEQAKIPLFQSYIIARRSKFHNQAAAAALSYSRTVRIMSEDLPICRLVST
jgi:hypothetical protein